jgi:peroxiredoxin
MAELGQLEARHEDFARRNARIIAASLEGSADAERTQGNFPHLLILSDPQRNLAAAMNAVHAHSGPGGSDTLTPTTILVDRQAVIRWIFRPENVMRRLSPDEVLAAVDEHLR